VNHAIKQEARAFSACTDRLRMLQARRPDWNRSADKLAAETTRRGALTVSGPFITGGPDPPWDETASAVRPAIPGSAVAFVQLKALRSVGGGAPNEAHADRS
jgi:hypothetical protein